MTLKVFGIGWHKTGTSTLGVALQNLGYNVCPEEIGYIGVESVYRDDYRYALRIAKLYEAFQDSPWNYKNMYRVLDVVFPDAKFVLTFRNPLRWYTSILRWVALHNNGNDINLLATIGVTPNPCNMEEVIASYTKYHDDVETYFVERPGKLLIADWETGSGWSELCGFLGKSVPNKPFPWILRYDPETTTYTNRVIHDSTG